MAKYVFIENVFGSKDRVERRKTLGKCFINGKPSSNYMRVCGKYFKKTKFFCGSIVIYLFIIHDDKIVFYPRERFFRSRR
jgi:hypothetical protein